MWRFTLRKPYGAFQIVYVHLDRISDGISGTRYPTLRLAGYPAGHLSGKFNIRHILNRYHTAFVSVLQREKVGVRSYPPKIWEGKIDQNGFLLGG